METKLTLEPRVIMVVRTHLHCLRWPRSSERINRGRTRGRTAVGHGINMALTMIGGQFTRGAFFDASYRAPRQHRPHREPPRQFQRRRGGHQRRGVEMGELQHRPVALCLRADSP